MTTLQHAALYFLALAEARQEKTKTMEEFEREIPFVLLPDAIRAYIGPRQVSHFEQTPDGADVSWIKFPERVTLKELSKENVQSLVAYKLADGYPPCVIGEKTDLRCFDRINLGHKHYHALRIHMIQDYILDEVLREEIINADQRFKDVFGVRHNQSMVIDGKELRSQIAKFERIGFIKLASIVYERFGVLLDREWFEKNVYSALLEAYPKDLAENTFKYMKLDDDAEARIQMLKRHKFEITGQDLAEVPIVFDLDRILGDMYADAYYYTRGEL